IGCVMPVNFHKVHYFNEIFGGMLDVLEAEEYALLTSYHNIPELPPLKRMIPTAVTKGEVDGLILVRTRVDYGPLIDSLQQSPHFGNRPIVTLMHVVPPYPAVITDDRLGAYQAAKHLLDLGHRHIMQLLMQQEDPVMASRLAGIAQAMTERGLDPNQHLHCFLTEAGWGTPYTLTDDLGDDENSRVISGEIGQRLLNYLQDHRNITAIIGTNDVSAIRVWHILQHRGWRIPDDMSIIGFDDTDPKVNIDGYNSLTTVRLPLADAGRTAARLIVDQVRGNTAPKEPIILPTELVIRSSTAPANR
ncbi:MAG TPA: LacI family DNA-binding transcriptional regulator, partial [Armatimonadota bacterium]|nr:LacI family DNA-binding transcriptional regulator [Armatimonadota bacterium]